MPTRFEPMLTGGHPNSLGRTEEVVELVLAADDGVDELLDTYASDDEVVRLRVSSALKRVVAAAPERVAARLDRILTEVAAIEQPSARWTLAQVVDVLLDDLTAPQRARAVEIVRGDLEHGTDWIVLGTALKVLGRWAHDDPDLAGWLRHEAARHLGDERSSVARIARRTLDELGAPDGRA